ncbi:carbohydrate-binding protein [Oceanicella sp. SM1341]|uniref:carbohydrate-binding protein n=1 Tax=Oceanicella sp. SM1341 TaxID=1548889 RepID=UPI000E46ED86|nr:carbohydrate-binding protein [Oceanicella sp. SM1341]
MISISFVDLSDTLVSGVMGSGFETGAPERLRIVADLDSLGAVQSFSVQLTTAEGAAITSIEVPAGPVVYIDGLGFDGLADGGYALTVQALDGSATILGETSGSFSMGPVDDTAAPLRIEAEDAALGAAEDASTGTEAPVIVSNDPAENEGSAGTQAQLDNASGEAFVDFSGLPSGTNNFNLGGGEWVEWTVTVAEAGEYDIAIGYAFNSSGATNRPMRLDVNGTLFDRVFDLRSTGDNATYGEAGTRVSLQPGENTIRLTSNGFSGPNIDYLELRPADPAVFSVQAEALSLTGSNVAVSAETLADGSDTFRPGAEGGSYLDWGTTAGTAGFGFDAPAAGVYEVRVTYAQGGTANRPLQLLGEGGAPLAGFTFAPTNGTDQVLRGLPDDLDDLPEGVVVSNTAGLAAGWEGWSTESQTITLGAAGATNLVLSGSGGPNIDKIEVILVAAAPTAVGLQNDSVLENAAGVDVGRILVSGDDGPFTFAVDDPRFEVVDGVLKLVDGVSLDHEAEGLLTLGLTATNAAGSVTGSVQLVVGDVNDAPVLAGSIADLDVPASGGTIVLEGLTATDQDGDATTLEAAGSLPPGISFDGSALTVAPGTTQGVYTIGLVASDVALSSGPVSFQLTVGTPGETGFETVFVQGEDMAILPGGDTSLVRTRLQNQERAGLNDTTLQAGTALEFDVYGLRHDYTGEGYFDINGLAGEKAAFTFEGPAGTYDVTLRLANGSSAERPLALATTEGQTAAQGTNTGTFYEWETRTFTITVTGEGPHEVVIVQTDDAGAPNIDAIAISAPGAEVTFPDPTPLYRDPTALDGDATTDEDTAVAVDIAALIADADQPGAPVVTGATSPDGTVSIEGTVLTFTPAPDFFGEATITYTVEDREGATATAGVTVTVAGVNDAPELSGSIAPATVGAEGGAIALEALVLSDVDGDPLTLVLGGAVPEGVTLEGSTLNVAEGVAPEVYEIPVLADDGALTSAPVVISLTVEGPAPAALGLAPVAVTENVAGAVVADITVTGTDSTPAAGDIVLSGADAALFRVIGTPGALQLALAEGVALDYEAASQPEVTVSFGDLSAGFTAAPANDPSDDAPVPVLFPASAISSYGGQDRPGDGGAGAQPSEDETSLTLSGNLWKRVELSAPYEVTAQTSLTLILTPGAIPAEVTGIGIDPSTDPFDGSGVFWELAGTQAPLYGGFTNLRGTAAVEDLGDGRLAVTIDLSGQAGQTLTSLVFFSDDDQASNGLGAPVFSNVQFVEGDGGGEPGNHAPRVVGGGVADLVVNEDGAIEVDLPFVDDDGDALTFGFTITDGGGADVTASFTGLSLEDGVLSGSVDGVAPGAYSVTLTASDGSAAAQDVFTLTVDDVNEAPVAGDAAFEPLSGAVGSAIAPIALADFTGVFSDPDGDALTFTVEGLPAGLTLNSEGVISGTPTETGSGSFTIVATDPGGLSASLEIDLVIDAPGIGEVVVVEAEDFTGLGSATNFTSTGQAGASNSAILRAVNSSGPSLITTNLTANGLVEGWYTVAMTFYDETDGNASFSLSVGDTVLADGLNFDDIGTFDTSGPRGTGGQAGNLKTVVYEQAVYVSAGTILTYSGQADGEILRTDKFTFTRVDEPNSAPVDIVLGTDSVAENAAGTVIGTLSATDAEGDSITFSVDAASDFEVVDGALKLKDGIALDFEAGATVDVAVTATDANGASTTETLTLTVTDVDEAPEPVTIDSDTVTENDAGAVIGTLSAADPEGGAVTFSVDPASDFEIVDGALKLKDGVSLNFEEAGTAEVTVTATDAGGLSTDTTLILTVADADDAPELAEGAELADLAVASGAGATVALDGLGATDEDGDAVSYAVRAAGEGTLPAGFAVVGDELIVPTDAPEGVYALEVYAEAGGLASAPVSFTVTVGEVAPFVPFMVQAETGAITLAQTADANSTQVRDPSNPETGSVALRPDFTGTGYLDFGNDAGDTVTLTIDVPVAGSYDLSVRYASNSDRPLDLSVNGGATVLMPFLSTDPDGTGTEEGFDHWEYSTQTVTLQAGSNTVSFAIPAGLTSGPNLDRIEITEAGTGPMDLSADEDGDLFLDGVSGTLNETQAASMNFNIAGVDDDIVKIEISFDNGTTRTDITGIPDADGDFVFDGSTLPEGPVTASIFVTDAAGNEAVATRSFTIGGDGIPDRPEDAEVFTPVVKINFEAPAASAPAGYETPEGYLSDTGQAYGLQSNGFTYGWVDVEDGAVTGTPLAQPENSARYKGDVAEASDLQKTYLHFEYPGAPAATNERAWEMAVENGVYQLTVAIGDTAGQYDSTYRINVEGQQFGPVFEPVNLDGVKLTGGAYDASYDGEGFRSNLYTGIVEVTDGRLTIDSIGGENTEIQWLDLDLVPDLTPDDDRSADLDYSKFVDAVAASLEDGQVSIEIGDDGAVPIDIDPTSDIVVGVQLQAIDHRGPNVTFTDQVKLVETLTGVEVAINVQVTGGADSLTIRPLQDLKENTSYTLQIKDVLDLGDLTDSSQPLRQFQDYSTTFVTGEAPEVVPREVAFTDEIQLDGFGEGGVALTSIEFGPDGHLYAVSIGGELKRWDVNEDGSLDLASAETLNLGYFQDTGRSIIGLVFDPEDPNVIWVTDNAPVPVDGKADQTPDFSGRISKITLGEDGAFEGASAETYLHGLPRSGGDHVTNSLEFRANPDAGLEGEPAYLLYLTQGSNTAAGRPDNAWGFRPERLLNAAVLEVDPRREPPEGGFDVQTEPYDPDVNAPTYRTGDPFNTDGTFAGYYNPFAEDAVLSIYGEGIRNGYDLVWHSNGFLYVPTNGTAAGGNTLDDPNTAINEETTNAPKQYDFLFQVQEGGYYGHPNPLLGHYVLNGGNPTAGVDPNEANTGSGGSQSYPVGVMPDPDYDVEGAYSLDFNKSPNGVTEYTSNVFGGSLQGAILFAQFSQGDNVRVIKVDPVTGRVTGDDVLRRPGGEVIDDYIDPLDIVENPETGQLYLVTLNRGTGASQIILLTPAPGDDISDPTADEGGDLTLTVLDASVPGAVIFAVTGLDEDIEEIEIAFNGGAATAVTLNAQGQFTFDLTGQEGPVTAVLTVRDEVPNTASAADSFTVGESEGIWIDAIEFTVLSNLTGTEATLVRRLDDPATHETGTGYDANLDGMNDGYDGLSYLDPNGGAEDKASFEVTVEAPGTYTFTFRMASTTERPLAIRTGDQSVAITGTNTGSFDVWEDFSIVLTLEQGTNTIIIEQTGAAAPNIDSVFITPLDVTDPDVTADEDGDLALALVDDTDPAAMVFEITGDDDDLTSFEVSVNGGDPETVTPDANGQFTLDLSGLFGAVTVALVVTDGVGNIADASADITIAGVPNDGTEDVDGVSFVKYEAENAALGGNPAIVLDTEDDRGQSGGGFVDATTPDDDTITWTIEVPEDGEYQIDILYALGAGKEARPMVLSLDGAEVETLAFPANSNAAEDIWGPETATLTLTAGVHTLSVVAPGGNGANIDYLRITEAPLGGEVDDTADEGGDLAVTLLDASDLSAVAFALAGVDDDIVSIVVSLDGGTTPLPVTFTEAGFTADLSGLTGAQTVTITVNDDDANTAAVDTGIFLGGDVPDDGTEDVGGIIFVKYEAENAALGGNPDIVLDTEDDRGQSGGGFVDATTPGDDTITWTVLVEESGSYQVDILYALGAGKAARPMALSLDGTEVETLEFPANSNTAEDIWGPETVTLELTAGVHTLSVLAPGGNGPNIDYLRITQSPITGDFTADEGGDLAVTLVDSSDLAAVEFGLAGVDDDIISITVSLDGGTTPLPVTFTETGFVADLTGITGPQTVTITVNDDNANTASISEPFTFTSVPNDGTEQVDGVTYVIYEAENAALGGNPDIVLASEDDRGQSGGGFVDATTPDDDTITWTIEVPEDGDYQVDILYALGLGKAPRPMALSLDGTVVETLDFPPNSNSAENIWGPESTTLTLTAGVHTLSVLAPGGNGANIDYLRITQAPIEEYDATYADVGTDGRIELEATDGSTRTLGESTAEFYFTVSEDGLYALDLAANAGAPDGGGLTILLSADGGPNEEVDQSAFPGLADTGEVTTYTPLQAGVEYRVTVISDAPGASALDYLDVRAVAGAENAEVEVQSLDPAFFDDRLHFSYIENPAEADGSGNDREFKSSGQVQISNTGTEPLEILDADVTGPFSLADPSVFDGLVLGAGESITVTVNFDRSLYTPPTGSNGQIDATSTVFEGGLTLRTNDADSPIATVDLAGFWQRIPEGGNEPNVNEVWKIFGFGNFIEGLSYTGGGENSTLSTFDVFAQTDETEVLSPYWALADGVTEARITHIAAFHGPGGASLAIHNPGDGNQQVGLGSHFGDDNQTILPNAGNNTAFQTRTITSGTIPDGWLGEEVFGIKVAGLSTDPRLNPTGDVIVPGAQQGHTVKVFQALDTEGVAIPDTYLIIMDYTGINYDYNDNMFVMEGVKPMGFGDSIVVSGLDDAAADDRLVFTNIDNPANGSQLFRNEAVITLTNEGFVTTTVTGVTIGGPNADDFEVVGALPTLAPGASAQITVRFIGSDPVDDNAAVLLRGNLTIETDGLIQPGVIELAGLAQNQSENGEEPNVAQIVEAFGYGTDMALGQLANGGQVETVGDEVLLPYLERLDDSRPVEVIQLAAFLNQGNVARLSMHDLDSASLTELFAADDQQGQTILPDGLVSGPGNTGTVARASFNPTEPFGLKVTVDGRPTYLSWTDPEINRIDPDIGHLVNDSQGHLIRYFEAKDADGNVIEGTYIAIQDYPGAGNYDYNDHMYIIRNVQGHALTADEDANADGINDALQTDADGDGTVAFFDPGDTPSEFGDYVVGFNVGGPAVASQQGLDGVALRGDGDPLISYSGDGATRTPGTDNASNPNGANALPGAFQTYRDGTNWTATVSGLLDGEYIVVLHTQETYFNASGQRQFDMLINGELVADNLDPFAVAGGDTAVSITATVQVTGGSFTITMDSIGPDGTNNAALNAITIFQSAANPGGGLDDGNEAPVAGTIADQGATEGDAFTLDISSAFSDADGDALSFTASGLPAGLTLSAAGVLSGTATADGVFEITVTASDGQESASTSFTLTVAPDEPGEQTPFPGPDAPEVDGAPLTVLAMNYDTGGQGVAYNDTPGLQGGSAGPRTGSDVELTSANDVGWIESGEWLEYTIDIAAGGLFDLDLLLSTTGGGRSATVAFYRAGEDTPYASTGPVANPSSGSYTTFVDRSAEGIGLEAGEQVMRVTFSGGSQDFRSFTLTPVGEPNQAPVAGVIAGQEAEEDEAFSFNAATAFSDADGDTLTFTASGLPDGLSISAAGLITGTPADPGDFAITVTASDGIASASTSFTLSVAAGEVDDGQSPFPGPDAPDLAGAPLTILAVNYDDGGQGVAYNDQAGLQGGTTGGRTGSDVEITTLGDVGYIQTGEWLEYTVDVASAGLFDLDLLMSTVGNNRSVTVAVYRPGEDTPYASTGPIANANTGAYTTFLTRSAEGLALEAGEQVLRVTFSGGSQDFRSFTLTPVGEPNQAPVAGVIAGQDAEEDEAFAFNAATAFSDPDGDALTFTASGLPDGLSISAAGLITGMPTESGDFTVTVTASDGSLQAQSAFTLSVAEPEPEPDLQAPFPGPAAPGFSGGVLTVDATNFDSGGQGISWNDATAGNPGNGGVRANTDVDLVGAQADIGYTQAGEWVEYTIDAPEAGTYTLSLSAKTPIGGNTVTVSTDTGTVLATVSLPDANGAGNTSFSGTEFADTAPVELTLAEGVQTLRFTFGGTPASNGYLLDMRSFTLEQAEPEPEDVIGLSGTVSVAQTGPDQWFSVSFSQALDAPSVVMGPLTSNDGDPATVRVRNVSDTGFEFQIDEWDYQDGVHGLETVSWMAVEQGVHQLANGAVIEAGSTTGQTSYQTVTFQADFAGAPVVAGQAASANGSGALVSRVTGVNADRFRFTFQEEEAADGAHVGERFDWIAISTGDFGDMAAGRAEGAVTHLGGDIDFPAGFGAEVDTMAWLQTVAGTDTANLRATARGPEGLSLYVAEETSADAEVWHRAEAVGWVVLEDDFIFV